VTGAHIEKDVASELCLRRLWCAPLETVR
jgi:hypothetical protein